MTKTNQEELLEFPCQFPIKIMGDNDDNLHKQVKTTLLKHMKEKDIIRLKTKKSTGNKYCSITAVFTASSRKQLDDLYKELSSNQLVKMVL